MQNSRRMAAHIMTGLKLSFAPACTGILDFAASNTRERIVLKGKNNMRDAIAGLTTVLVAIAISYGTLMPPGGGGGLFLGLTDKQLHGLAFALLVLPMTWANPRNAIWLVPMALVFGGLIEMIQPIVGRGAEWADFWADAAGVCLGVGAGYMLSAKRAR